ncbi:sphingosine-1-phosphate lyase [Galendromus occidentalis]|uniref:sphinganine-1-phosphate aldolase n=1 Tax=Galendromus occidentalis TaxID=34638 RepID=A0AAJ6VXZ7_9ACAR|nr:sphingosine-1-phosphate lyase [Galendromus occidentalis]
MDSSLVNDMFGYSSVERPLWDEIQQELDDLRNVYWPTDGKELADIGMLVGETFLRCVGLIRHRINKELEGVEPLCLVTACFLFFLSLWVLKRLFTYNSFVPSNKRLSLLERFRRLPIIRSISASKMRPVLKDLERDLKKDYAPGSFKKVLPEEGHKAVNIVEEVQSYLDLSKADWKAGRVSGCIYSPNDIECEKLVLDVFHKTMKSNHLHADIFSGVRKMEAEIIRWVLNLYHGDADACGSISSGGTESIMLACKAYRDFAFATRGITEPEILVPHSAHAAFDKAADWLRLEIRKVPLDPKTLMVDTRKMRKMITRNTILLVGSAPGYPHGIIDPIEGIAALGCRYNIPVHVDCCLGGFIMPFLEDAGFGKFNFDFSVKGVTSISCDTHKYAMAPKGTSLVMYSSKKYLHHQFSAAGDWPGGVYITPTVAGSRSGAVVACCWATLRYYGRGGYVEACRDILTEARKIKDGIKEIKGLRVLGDPQATVIAFDSDIINIFEVNSRMGKLGWHLNPLQFPSGIHICLTKIHAENKVTETFLTDLRTIVEKMLQEPDKKVSSQAAVYGQAQTFSDRSIVKDLLLNYMDIIYSTEDYVD